VIKNGYANFSRDVRIKLGENVFLPYGAHVTVPELFVGDHTRINGPITIRGRRSCEIGKFCAIGYFVSIITTNHDMTRANLQLNMQRRFGFRDLEINKGPVIIGNNVWIGDNVTILSGTRLGDGCVVGTGSVVTKNIEPFGIAYGSPAQVERYRFTQPVIEKLMALKWWDWPEERISRNRVFFEMNIAESSAQDVERMVRE